MSLEKNKELAQRFSDQVFNQGNLQAVDDLLAPNYINHTALPNLPPGSAGTKIFVSMFRAVFPDLSITIDDMIAEGDKVVVRHTTRGTHTGTFLGIPPTGCSIQSFGVDIVRIVDDKLVEDWGIIDQPALMQQLGFAPSPH